MYNFDLSIPVLYDYINLISVIIRMELIQRKVIVVQSSHFVPSASTLMSSSVLCTSDYGCSQCYWTTNHHIFGTLSGFVISFFRIVSQKEWSLNNRSLVPLETGNKMETKNNEILFTILAIFGWNNKVSDALIMVTSLQSIMPLYLLNSFILFSGWWKNSSYLFIIKSLYKLGHYLLMHDAWWSAIPILKFLLLSDIWKLQLWRLISDILELNLIFCSCFGQNLQTSSNAWENFFVILVTISGLVLMLFLIGNIQVDIYHLVVIFHFIFIRWRWRRIFIFNSYELRFLWNRYTCRPKLHDQRRWPWGCKRWMSTCPFKSSLGLFNSSLRYINDTYGENLILLM